MHLSEDDQRGSSRVSGVSRSFDQRRQVSSCGLTDCGSGGSFLEHDRWARGDGGVQEPPTVVNTQVC